MLSVSTSRRRAALALLLAASLGCRTYAEVPMQSLAAGGKVRVRLTAAGSTDVAATIGPRGDMLEGAVVARDDSTLTVSPSAITRIGGDEEKWPGDPVVVPSRAVAGVDKVRTSTSRTLMLVGAVVAVLALARQAFGGGDAVGRTGTGGTQPPQ